MFGRVHRVDGIRGGPGHDGSAPDHTPNHDAAHKSYAHSDRDSTSTSDALQHTTRPAHPPSTSNANFDWPANRRAEAAASPWSWPCLHLLPGDPTRHTALPFTASVGATVNSYGDCVTFHGVLGVDTRSGGTNTGTGIHPSTLIILPVQH
jgi:hypothetical protein